MRKDSYSCDICTAQRGESNHYLLVERGKGISSPCFRVWDDRLAKRKTIGHVCGATCALKITDKWLTEQQAARSAPRAAQSTSVPPPLASPLPIPPDPAPTTETGVLVATLENASSCTLGP